MKAKSRVLTHNSTLAAAHLPLLNSPLRPQKIVSVNGDKAVSVVDPTAFAAALALERDGHEKVGQRERVLPRG